MTATHKNRLKTTISAVAGSGLGALTISTASSGYRTFGAGDDGFTFDGVLIVEGTAWEVRDGCVYTHSGTSLSRGTLQDSSTGSAITFTSAAVVSQGGSAGLAARIEQVALSQVDGADANTTMETGTLYIVNMSAWATADRTYTLPATAAVGDRCAVLITVGDASHELILTAGSGDTLNGVAGGTEWSRVFITGEVVVMRCIVANTAWVVEQDGRIPQQAILRVSTAGTTNTATAITNPTASSGCVMTADANIGDAASAAAGTFTARRAGKYLATGQHMSQSSITASQYGACFLYNGSTIEARSFSASGATHSPSFIVTKLISCAVDDVLDMRFRNQEANKGIATESNFTVFEVL